MQSDGPRGHVIVYMRHKSISRRQPLWCFSLLSLWITLALNWREQLQLHHNIQILGFSVHDFASMRILAYRRLNSHRATRQLLDSSLSSKSNSLTWVCRHELFLLITPLSLVQTRNVWEQLLLQVQYRFCTSTALPTSICRRAADV